MSELVSSHVQVAVAFWLCVAVIGVALVAASLLKRMAALATVRAAIERGHSLDPDTIGRILGNDEPPRDQRKDLVIQACVWTSLGVGFCLFGLIGFGGRVHYVFLGLGCLLLCLGAGLAAAARLHNRVGTVPGTAV